MKIPRSAIHQVVEAVLELKTVRTATKYLSTRTTVKASVHGKRRADGQQIVVLTIGRPNYIERRFIKDAVKAGEPFPIRKVQLKFTRTATDTAGGY